jgi:hypothetical protein
VFSSAGFAQVGKKKATIPADVMVGGYATDKAAGGYAKPPVAGSQCSQEDEIINQQRETIDKQNKLIELLKKKNAQQGGK